jgi:hypothetical protein
MSHPMFKKGLYSDYTCSPSVVWKGNNLQNIFIFLKQALESWLQFQFNPPEKQNK